LTEFLDECWNENAVILDAVAPYCMECRRSHGIRTFTTWDDLGKVKDKLVEKGLFKIQFLTYAFCEYEETVKNARLAKKLIRDDCYIAWLLNPARFCQLVADFIRGERCLTSTNNSKHGKQSATA
jgi:hypothetical protein